MATYSQTQTALARAGGLGHERANLRVAAREAFWIALEALRTHKLRSFLTLLGVVVATTTLIVVMSVINGMNLYIANHIANLGVNTFVVSQFEWATGREGWLRQRLRNRPIRMSDYRFLEQNLEGYDEIGAQTGMDSNVRFNGQTMFDVELDGVTPSMIDINFQQVDYGRYFTEADEQHAAPVCFVGQDVVTKFFPSVNPLNHEIAVNGRPFRIIGVAKKIGTTFGESEDNFVQIPLNAYRRKFVSRPNLNISVKAYDSAQMQPLEEEARMLMRVRRHLPFHEKDTFGINESQTIMSLWERLTGSIFAATTAIVAIFMVIGGIVIMNIMLASVTERTHEIGIRKSLGARRADILMQFVMESAAMAAAGGVVGVLIAALVDMVVNHFFTASLPISAVVLGVSLSAVVGLFFGIYPASKAARLEPIEALRVET